MQNSLQVLPFSEADLLVRLEKEQARRSSERRLLAYKPYPKQLAFHVAGAHARERLLMAGNQLGKTLSAGYETAMHLTGIYPDWWQGRRWDRAVVGWAAGVTGEGTRDNPQRILLGRPNAIGTGAIPKSAILDYSSSRGLADAVDTVQVKHVTGEASTLQFKSYEKGREKWQGETLDFLWFDEEPPADIYTEGLTRTNATGGMTYVTFTPLLGMSDVVKRFLLDKVPGTHVTTMTIDDAEHYTDEQRAAIIASYPAFEREARVKGIPQLGSGRVFPLDEDDILVKPFPIPEHWPQIAGMDFGWDHPSAAVRLAWDRDADCVYVTACFRAREHTPAMFTNAVRSWGANPNGSQWLPWAWPHDGLQHDKGSGEQLATQYRTQGLALLPQRATFEDGTFGVEAGITEMLDRMQSGRFRVFSHLTEWVEEFRLYHRKDGLIVKEGDDLMSATRYAIMMRRFAQLRAKSAPKGQLPQMPRNNGWMG